MQLPWRRARVEPRTSWTTEHAMASKETELAKHAERPPQGILAEFWDFLIYNKKWWLTPIILVLLLMGVLVMLSGTAAAPFIYTLW